MRQDLQKIGQMTMQQTKSRMDLKQVYINKGIAWVCQECGNISWQEKCQCGSKHSHQVAVTAR